MKNLRFIILCLFFIQNYIQSSDADTIGFYKDDISEPNTTIFYHVTKKEVPDQELSRKVDPETNKTIIHRLTSNPHYKPKAIPTEPDYTGVKFPTLKTPADNVNPDLQEREEKLKKFRKQEKAAQKIQKEWRSRKKSITTEKNLETADDKHKNNVSWNKLGLETRIKNLANQSYPKFKELICTSDYLTKTDWIYQFIEAAEDKTIFERNLDGTINPEKFTPEFEKEIENSSDWLDDAITKYLPEFHDIVYEAFIDKATEQIVKYKASWADAVSIPAPQGHGSFQEEGTPLFPKVYYNEYSSNHELILGRIFVTILKAAPQIFEKLNFDNLIKFEYSEKDSSSDSQKFYIKIFDRVIASTTISSSEMISANDKRSILLQKIKEKDIDFLALEYFSDYLTELGLEFSPEEQKQFDEVNAQRFEQPEWNRDTEPYEEYLKKYDDFEKKITTIMNAQYKFLSDHINWASSARQTFYLGQLIFDKDLTAFDALGGQEWLEKQPKNVQEYITKYIEKIKDSRLNTRMNNALKGGMRSMWSKKE